MRRPGHLYIAAWWRAATMDECCRRISIPAVACIASTAMVTAQRGLGLGSGLGLGLGRACPARVIGALGVGLLPTAYLPGEDHRVVMALQHVHALLLGHETRGLLARLGDATPRHLGCQGEVPS